MKVQWFGAVVLAVIVAACGNKADKAATSGGSPAGSAVAPAAPKPGDPLELRVRVTRPDGTPARNTPARVYHTDAEGYYLKHPDGTEAGSDKARLAFTVTTDNDGRFTLTTIVPARYPQGGPPSHVHLHVPPEHPDDLTIMLDHDPSLDRDRIAKMLRTWIGRVRVDGTRAICEADIVAP